MCLQIGRVDHDRLLLAVLDGQTGHDLREGALVAPSLPAIVECLVRAVFRRRVTTAQPIPIDKYNPAQLTLVIDARLAVGLSKIGLEARHLRNRQPKEIRHVQRSFFEQ